MNRIVLAAYAGALMLVGAGTGTAVAATSQWTLTGATAQAESTRSGASMMSDAEIKQKLQAEGYANVQLGEHERGKVDATATKNGQPVDLEIDVQSGAVSQHIEKEGDDDDD